MHVPPDDQDAFDRDLWRPLEARFHDKLGNFSSAEFSGFFRVFLERSGRYVKEDAIFETFEERYEAAGFCPVDLAKELTTFVGLSKMDSGIGSAFPKSPGMKPSTSRMRPSLVTTSQLGMSIVALRYPAKCHWSLYAISFSTVAAHESSSRLAVR